jgi:hypothetical protein
MKALISSSCEPSCEGSDIGDEDPSGGAFDRRLEVLCEPGASAEPGESALYDPARGRSLKPFAMSDRLMISSFHAPIRLRALWSFGPA